MGVYSNYIQKDIQTESVEFNAPDRTFKGIMNTVCEIHEMDQKMFESLLELDFASIILKEDGENEKAKESKIKNILAAVKKLIDKAVNAVKTAISNFIEKIQKSGAEKVKEYADFVVKSDKLKDFKFETKLLKADADSILMNKKKDIIDTNMNSYRTLQSAASAEDINNTKSSNLETINKALEIKIDDLFESTENKTFSAEDIKKLAEKFDVTKHTIKGRVEKMGNELISQIKKQGSNFESTIKGSNSDLKEAAAEAAYSIASNSTKGFLKLQNAVIDVIIKDYKNSRSLILSAYSFCKKGTKVTSDEKKSEETATSESVLIDNICESSDMFIDGLMLV